VSIPDREHEAYFKRKAREIEVINRCLQAPLALPSPTTLAEAVERKFRIAGALRAERSHESWAITETARPGTSRWSAGAFRFRFGYQRADLEVRGPAIYPDEASAHASAALRQTLYTGSGMSALGSVFVALRWNDDPPEVLVPHDGYGETRELLDSLGFGVRSLALGMRVGAVSRCRPRRVLIADSSVRSDFEAYRRLDPAAIDLIVFDTTCFWRTSSKIARLDRWALRAGVPLVCVRSHAKLDCLGIEYGRLGSIVFALRRDASALQRDRIVDLARKTADAIRLLGAAPVPTHFPPFAGLPDYAICSAVRTAAAMRNTRRLARTIRASSRNRMAVTSYQHGMYLTLPPAGDATAPDLKQAAAELCGTLAARGLPVKHAGSFGFDFATIEWFPDPVLQRNVIRVAPGDVPLSIIDRMGIEIARWWRAQGMASATPVAFAAD